MSRWRCSLERAHRSTILYAEEVRFLWSFGVLELRVVGVLVQNPLLAILGDLLLRRLAFDNAKG